MAPCSVFRTGGFKVGRFLRPSRPLIWVVCVLRTFPSSTHRLPSFFLFEISSFDFPPVRFKRKNFGRLTRDPPVHVTPSVSACSNFGEQFTFNFHSFIIDPADISRVWQLTFLNSKKRLWFLQIKQIVPAEAAAVNSIRPIKLETVKLLAGNVSMQLAH